MTVDETTAPVENIGKVLMLSGSFPPMPCGVGDSVNELAHEMARAGMHVEVLTDRRADEVATGEGPVTVHAEIADWGLRGIKRLVKAVEILAPDILHIHYPTKAYGTGLAVPFLPMLIRARRRPFRIVVTLHEFRISHPARRMASFVLIDAAHAVTMPCPLELEALGRRHISVAEKINGAIPGGAVGPSPEGFTPEQRDEMRRRKREEWGIGDDRVVLLHYGTPTFSKGIEILFKALKILKLEGETPLLVIVGEHSPETDEFYKLLHGQPGGLGVGDQVRWLGRVPDAELPGTFLASDVGVFPFLDGFSFRRTSLVGVLRWDIPIVTTEPAGDLQQIGSQEKVIFCARCDPRSLATALLPLIANRKVLDRLRAAPNPLKEYFRWDLIVRQYIDIYRLVRNLK
jgi:glycosyltransferase involved in cell wall biosynthesis